MGLAEIAGRVVVTVGPRGQDAMVMAALGAVEKALVQLGWVVEGVRVRAKSTGVEWVVAAMVLVQTVWVEEEAVAPENTDMVAGLLVAKKEALEAVALVVAAEGLACLAGVAVMDTEQVGLVDAVVMTVGSHGQDARVVAVKGVAEKVLVQLGWVVEGVMAVAASVVVVTVLA